ncbi:MAG: hypothetical protein AAFV98_10315 [Chloroflexota bacterium]
MLAELHGENPTRIGLALIYGTAVIGTALLAWYTWQLGLSLNAWQWLALLIVAADILGGAVANMTRSTNTYYRSKSYMLSVGFLVMHIAHPALLAWSGLARWSEMLWLYGYMLIAGLFILSLADTEHQKAVAVVLWVGGVLLANVWFSMGVILLWFVPLYLFKLLMAFAVTHYPISPETKKAPV